MEKIRVIKTDIRQNKFLSEETPLKFRKDRDVPDGIELELVNVYDEVRYQTILGIGGAFTDAAAVNYAKMTDEQKKEVSDAYFSEKKGIDLDFCRICINSSDYAADFYTCDDVDGDSELIHFNIDHDKKEIIPMIRDALKRNPDMRILASPWSPPAWMKTNGKMENGGYLKKEYRAAWALFFARFIQAYAAEGVPIYAVTVQNEAKAEQWWESCLYDAADERDFVTGFLRPTLDREGLGDVKIFCWDHNKERVVDRALVTFGTNTGRVAFDGMAHHWYSGDHFAALDAVHRLFPEKYLIGTENSSSAVDAIPYYGGEKIAHELIGDFNNHSSAYMDWNLILDKTGHPYHWDKERAEAQKKRNNAFVNQSMQIKHRPSTPIMLWGKELHYDYSYYYLGQFSKFLRKDAVRIASSVYSPDLESVAFLNPDGSRVLVVMNKGEKTLPAVLRFRNSVAPYEMTPHSIATFLF